MSRRDRRNDDDYSSSESGSGDDEPVQFSSTPSHPDAPRFSTGTTKGKRMPPQSKESRHKSKQASQPSQSGRPVPYLSRDPHYHTRSPRPSTSRGDAARQLYSPEEGRGRRQEGHDSSRRIRSPSREESRSPSPVSHSASYDSDHGSWRRDESPPRERHRQGPGEVRHQSERGGRSSEEAHRHAPSKDRLPHKDTGMKRTSERRTPPPGRPPKKIHRRNPPEVPPRRDPIQTSTSRREEREQRPRQRSPPRFVRPLPTARRRNHVLTEIRHLQRSTNLLLRKSPFSRLVREVLRELTGSDVFRWERTALEALQEVSEKFLLSLMQYSYMVTQFSGRVTLMAKDMQLVRRITDNFDLY